MADQSSRVSESGAQLPVEPVDARHGTRVLQRLVAEWRIARSKLGLSSSATVVEIAAKLNVDRGTAQRLNRLAKMLDVTPADLGFFPGVRAWNRVLIGVENVLGADNPSFERLSLAADHFSSWLESVGGSRSAAMRHNAQQSEPPGPRSGSEPGRENGRARWVDAAAEVLGYSVDTLYHAHVMQESPAEVPTLLDVASLHVLQGCRGTASAMPIAFSRASYTPDHKLFESQGGADDPRSFYVLRSGTSKPAPSMLSTGDSRRQTVFVEPNWASLSAPLSLALLHLERGAMKIPWGTENEWMEFALINRHPCRKMVLECIVSAEIDRKCSASMRVFRSHVMMAHDEPWYDRIPEDTTTTRVGTVTDALTKEPFTGYSAIIGESLDRVKWDPDKLIVHRAVIENAIPLATYTIMFDKV